MTKKSAFNRFSPGDYVVTIVMLLICFISLYPVWYTIIISFNDSSDAMRGGIYWYSRKFSLESYRTVFQDKTIMNAFMVTILRTLIGTVTSVFFTAMVGYALSKKHIWGNKFYLIFGTITMFFNGGLIPFFILLKNMGHLIRAVKMGTETGLEDDLMTIPSYMNYLFIYLFISFN